MSKDRTRACLTVAIVLLACSQSFAQAADYDRRPRTASVSGRVTIEGKPAANVTVTVKEARSEMLEARIFSLGGREFVDHRFYKATTDAEGRYQISGLPAGQYIISTDSPAYLPQSRALGSDASIKITLDEGEAREKIDLALIRGGVITGRVTDEDGRPQVGRYVRMIELVDRDQFREVGDMRAGVTALETDDRGIYRIFGLRSGRYVVMAGGENDILRGAIRSRETQLTYHPDVVRQEEAKVIEVREGEEVTGVDIRLRNPGATFTASGRLINSETGKPLPQTRVICFPVENPEDESGNWAADTLTDSEGNFTATGLKPGKYKAKYCPPQEGGEYYGEGKYFEVSDGDVSGVEVTVRRGAVINGAVIVEEGRDATTNAKLSEARVMAQVWKGWLVGNTPYGSTVGFLDSKIGNDGSFRMTGVPPGKADIRLSSSSKPLLRLRVERDGVEVNGGLEVRAGEEINSVRVIIGQGAGVIRGTLKIVGGVLPEGVVLSVYAGQGPPNYVGGSGEVDEKGRFVIEGLAPGEYSLSISWSIKYSLPSGQYLTLPRLPEKRVSVTNGAETQVSLTYDLSRKEQEKQ
jgi:Carboxypeptidase regulatory-like domain